MTLNRLFTQWFLFVCATILSLVATSVLLPAYGQDSGKGKPKASISPESPYQSHAALKDTVLKFLENHPGITPESRIELAPIDSQLQLLSCSDISTYLPSNPSKISGTVRVSVRCLAPTTWLTSFTAKVLSLQKYGVWNQNLAAGTVLTGQELNETTAWSDQVPTGALSDFQFIQGKTLKQNVFAGGPATVSMVKAEHVITAGQSVKIVINGNGFKISSDGKALHAAVAGQAVQVRTATGQMVSGLAVAGGWVEVTR